ncbi:hypothetical protein [Xanthomonas theicola]|uniref:hypothetical protein n=1 Tax=Xanthomonas theicola TaxID=56464 RepID=UPI003CCE0C5A
MHRSRRSGVGGRPTASLYRLPHAPSRRSGTRRYRTAFAGGDAFLFGPETRGLPADMLDRVPPGRRRRLPMPRTTRLNLSDALVVVFAAWRSVRLPRRGLSTAGGSPARRIVAPGDGQWRCDLQSSTPRA